MTVFAVLLVLNPFGPALPPRPPDLVPPAEAAAYPGFYAREVAAFSARHALQACPAPRIRPVGVRFSSPVSVLGPPQATSPFDGPIYRESWTILNCGTPAIQNMAVIHQRGGGWRALGVLPGQTLADIRLQHDAMTSAAAAAVLRPPPGCAPARASAGLKIVDTQVMGPPAGPGAPWKERWLFQICGAQTKGVVMTFRPSPKGGVDYGASPT